MQDRFQTTASVEAFGQQCPSVFHGPAFIGLVYLPAADATSGAEARIFIHPPPSVAVVVREKVTQPRLHWPGPFLNAARRCNPQSPVPATDGKTVVKLADVTRRDAPSPRQRRRRRRWDGVIKRYSEVY